MTSALLIALSGGLAVCGWGAFWKLWRSDALLAALTGAIYAMTLLDLWVLR